MRFSDEAIDAMIKAGLITAFGGTGDNVNQVVATVGQCDEVTAILRRNGKAVGVLVVADDAVEGAADRGQEVLKSLQ